MSKYEIWTLERCTACESALTALDGDLKTGKVKRIHCSQKTDPDAKLLRKAQSLGIDGFPTVLKRNTDGTYCEVNPNDLNQEVKCFPKKY